MLTITHWIILALKGSLVPLSIPDDLKAGKAKIRVTVSGAITHQSEADVTVQAKSVSMFIQTDKAMYKPSQTGMESSQISDSSLHA